LYISDIKNVRSFKYGKQRKSRKAIKTAIVYIAVAAFCVIFDRVYTLFGHGVTSAAMDCMFLYPLVGGALPYLILWQWAPFADQTAHFRLYCNTHNSGIAALTTGSALIGVFEIAGTSSDYTIAFFILGWTLFAVGLLGYAFTLIRRRVARP
jgi:hypothetical protein